MSVITNPFFKPDNPYHLQALNRKARAAINRKIKRKLFREVSLSSFLASGKVDDKERLIELLPVSPKPPGCAFLGSKATEVKTRLGSLDESEVSTTIDTGSDITLISSETILRMKSRPKIRTGQRIKLVQVTGNAVITGYVTLKVYFETEEGPVVITVEAYVVRGMSVPFLIGNDFSEQYSLSVLRSNGATTLILGDSGRKISVTDNPVFALKDCQGQTCKVTVDPQVSQNNSKARAAKRRRVRLKAAAAEVHTRVTVVIPAGTTKRVPIVIHKQFTLQSVEPFLERGAVYRDSGKEDLLFGWTDTLINKDSPSVLLSNFSSEPIVVEEATYLGKLEDATLCLERECDLSEKEKKQRICHSRLISSLVNQELEAQASSLLNQTIWKDPTHNEDVLTDETLSRPVEGGPKTAEVPPLDVPSREFLEVVDLAPELSAQERQRLIEVLWRNKDAFALDGKLGNYEEEVTVPMKEGSKPVSLPPFPMSPANRAVIDEQMDKWMKLDVIEPSKSPWAAPVFIVYRNAKPRMVIDLRKLNESVVPDEHPIPRQEEILQSLQGCKYLSSLDALAGFTQLSIHEDDREKLAFRTHRGLFQFKRMPFGYRNGPAVFQRVMQNVLSPYLWLFTLVYIDDIVIYSKTFDEHLAHVDLVLKAIMESKLTLSPDKCHFGYGSILLLGQKVSRLGLSTHKEKVQSILDLETPKNVKTLQTFLGMMVYFSSYIPFYSWIAHPLFQLLKKGTKWEWKAEHQNAFELCKEVLTEAPVRAHAMPGRPYRVYSDACDFGLAAILQQVQPVEIRDLRGTRTYDRLRKAFDKGEKVPVLAQTISKDVKDVPEDVWASDFESTTVHIERVIAYWSRVLQSAERNYSPTEREALALKEGLVKFQVYLEGEKVLAITDHAALQWSRTFQNVNRRLLSWGLVFSAFPNMTIVHRPGRVHSNVDPISRLRRRIPDQLSPNVTENKGLTLNESDGPMKDMYEALCPKLEEKVLSLMTQCLETEELEDVSQSSEPIRLTVSTSKGEEINSRLERAARNHSLLISVDPTELTRWKEAYSTDSHFTKILNHLQENDPVTNQRYAQSDEGLLYFNDNLGNNRLCVPSSLVNEIMSEIHDRKTEGAHGGYFKTYNRVGSTYYWPGMSRTIKRWVETCDVCQKTKPRRHGPVGHLQSIPIPTRPFETLTMDFIPDLPTTPNGFNNVFVVVDKLTKYGFFIPTTTTLDDEDSARLLTNEVLLKYGLPRQIISDRDPRWTSGFWKEICRLLGVKRALTTAYHPQSDGQTEIMNQYLEIAIRAYITPNRTNWDELLKHLAFSYNTSVHTATGFSPFYLLHGFHPATESSLMHAKEGIERPGESLSATDERAQGFAEAFAAERHRAQEALALAQLSQQRDYNKGRLAKEFEVGDLVVINRDSLELGRTVKGRGKKLDPKYEGPFEILEKISAVAYRLRMPVSYGIHPVLNIAHLEKYEKSPTELGPRTKLRKLRADFDQLEEVEVERIVDERTRKVGSRQVKEYRVRYAGFPPDHDEWMRERGLKNAPQVLRDWEEERRRMKNKIADQTKNEKRLKGRRGGGKRASVQPSST